jgi:hypothetical protein
MADRSFVFPEKDGHPAIMHIVRPSNPRESWTVTVFTSDTKDGDCSFQGEITHPTLAVQLRRLMVEKFAAHFSALNGRPMNIMQMGGQLHATGMNQGLQYTPNDHPADRFDNGSIVTIATGMMDAPGMASFMFRFTDPPNRDSYYNGAGWRSRSLNKLIGWLYDAVSGTADKVPDPNADFKGADWEHLQ